MLDPGGAAGAVGMCFHVFRGVAVHCPDDNVTVFDQIQVDWGKAAMVVLLIVLLVWWVETWKRHKFKDWWE